MCSVSKFVINMYEKNNFPSILYFCQKRKSRKTMHQLRYEMCFMCFEAHYMFLLDREQTF